MDKQYYVGIDIGSTASKVVVLDDEKLVSSFCIPTGWNSKETAKNILQRLQDDGLSENMSCAATGYGRICVDYADKVITEITCHAKGAYALFGVDGTVIDIGGQDAKVICLNDSGRMTNFVMNDKCAAGTGRFLDVMANILRADISELEVLASKADSPATISSTCTVFAESEVISQLANGESRENVIAGICNSVASRVSSLARRAGVKEKVCMSGGVAKNGAVRDAMSKALEVQIEYDSLAQYFGAIGAAVYAFRSNKK